MNSQYPKDNRTTEEKIVDIQKVLKEYNFPYLNLFIDLVKKEKWRHQVQWVFNEKISEYTFIDGMKYLYDLHYSYEDKDAKEDVLSFDAFLKERAYSIFLHNEQILKDEGVVGLYYSFVETELNVFIPAFLMGKYKKVLLDKNTDTKKMFYCNNAHHLEIEHDFPKKGEVIEKFWIKVDSYSCNPYTFVATPYSPVLVRSVVNDKNKKRWEIVIGSKDDWSVTASFKTENGMRETLLKIKHALPVFPVQMLGGVHFYDFKF